MKILSIQFSWYWNKKVVIDSLFKDAMLVQYDDNIHIHCSGWSNPTYNLQWKWKTSHKISLKYINQHLRHQRSSNKWNSKIATNAAWNFIYLFCSFELRYGTGTRCCVSVVLWLTILPPRRETPGSIPTSTKKMHDIYGTIWKRYCV